MIPLILPRLVTDALKGGWSVSLSTGAVILFAHFRSPAGDHVELEWEDGKTVHSAINNQPTQYRQCVALIRNPEGA